MRRQKSYSTEEYEQAMQLLKKGYSLTQVCKLMGWPITKKTTLYYWKKGLSRPPSTRWRPKPSKELAYVIGVLYGDGNIERHGYHYDIKLNTIDYEFADAFSKAMAKLLDKKYEKPKYIGIQRGRNYGWKVTYSSKAFYQWYRKQNLDILKQYIEHNKDTVAHFLRGLYDSDGSNYMCKKISLYNSNIELLRYVQYLLKRYFNIIARGPYLTRRAGSIMKRIGKTYKRSSDNYVIAICRKLHVQRFLSEIGFSITEKQLGLPRRK